MTAQRFDLSSDGGVLCIRGACLRCAASLTAGTRLPVGVPRPVSCDVCGQEHEVTVVGDHSASVRLPYGCDAWTMVKSSNLAAVGMRQHALFVRFRSGAVYRYARLAIHYESLLAAESKGQYFHRHVRPHPAERLCACCGCDQPAHPSSQRVVCRDHLGH